VIDASIAYFNRADYKEFQKQYKMLYILQLSDQAIWHINKNKNKETSMRASVAEFGMRINKLSNSDNDFQISQLITQHLYII